MWYSTKTNSVIKAARGMTIDGITYPRQIFKDKTMLKSLGIMPYREEKSADSRFYWQGEETLAEVNGEMVKSFGAIPRILEDREENNEDGTPMLDENGDRVITLGLKSNAISVVKQQARGILSKTGWMVERASEPEGKAIPDDVLAYRRSVRAKSDDIEAAITGCADLDAFIALYDTPVDGEGMPTGNAPITDWPDTI